MAAFALVAIVSIYYRAFRQIDGRDTLPMWLMMAWYVGLCVATPVYAPYIRLTLTWLGAAWLMTAIGASETTSWLVTNREKIEQRIPRPIRLIPLAAILILAAATVYQRGMQWRAWDDRSSMARLAEDIVTIHGERFPNTELYVVVYGEPSIVYQLNATGRALGMPVAGNSFMNLPPPVYLVAGPHAEADPTYQDFFATNGQYLTKVREFEIRLSSHVNLNQTTAERLANVPDASMRKVVLYVTGNPTGHDSN